MPHLAILLLAASTANTNTVNNVSLLGLVSHAASLIGSAGASEPHNARELSELPASHTEKEAEHVTLLLLPELLNWHQTNL